MPEYNFYCDSEENGCGETFNVVISIKDYDNYKPKCPKCKKQKTVHRDYAKIKFTASVPHTVGSLIDKNTAKFSQAEKDHLARKTRKNSVRES